LLEHLLLEAGFTGTKKDSLGRTIHYQDGKRVAAPKQAATTKTAAKKPAPANPTDVAAKIKGHLDAGTLTAAHVKALAGQLGTMTVAQLGEVKKTLGLRVGGAKAAMAQGIAEKALAVQQASKDKAAKEKAKAELRAAKEEAKAAAAKAKADRVVAKKQAPAKPAARPKPAAKPAPTIPEPVAKLPELADLHKVYDQLRSEFIHMTDGMRADELAQQVQQHLGTSFGAAQAAVKAAVERGDFHLDSGGKLQRSAPPVAQATVAPPVVAPGPAKPVATPVTKPAAAHKPLSMPKTKAEATATAEALRGALEKVMPGAVDRQGMCVATSTALASALPGAQVHAGTLRLPDGGTDDHAVVKVGKYWIDVTADQYGGGERIRVFDKLPKEYQGFEPVNGRDLMGKKEQAKSDEIAAVLKKRQS